MFKSVLTDRQKGQQKQAKKACRHTEKKISKILFQKRSYRQKGHVKMFAVISLHSISPHCSAKQPLVCTVVQNSHTSAYQCKKPLARIVVQNRHQSAQQCKIAISLHSSAKQTLVHMAVQNRHQSTQQCKIRVSLVCIVVQNSHQSTQQCQIAISLRSTAKQSLVQQQCKIAINPHSRAK